MYLVEDTVLMKYFYFPENDELIVLILKTDVFRTITYKNGKKYIFLVCELPYKKYIFFALKYICILFCFVIFVVRVPRGKTICENFNCQTIKVREIQRD